MIDTYQKALKLIRGDDRPNLLRSLGRSYLDGGFIEKAKYYNKEAFTLDSNKVLNLGYLAWLEFCNENFEEALKLTKEANEIDTTYISDIVIDIIVNSIPTDHNNDAFTSAKKYIHFGKKTGVLLLGNMHRIGYAYWQVGKKKEAEYYFKQQIQYSEECIKLNREYAQMKATQYDLAATYAFLGDKGKAYQYLEEFNKKNVYPLWWVVLAKHDPLFASIRNEERFQKILQNIEAKYQAEHERVRKWLEEQGML
jgi:tetratricopeptide (TPR) repeat protein